MYEYKFDKESCWYKTNCPKFNTSECNDKCIRYMEMHYLIENSNIPKSSRYKNKLSPSACDLDSFKKLNEIKSNIEDFVDNGENLYIYSKNFGNGKTSWGIKLMLQYFNKVWLCNGFVIRGLFIHTPTFLTMLKNNVGKRNEEFEMLKEQILTVDLVVWDDIASSKLSDFDHTNLLTYIDQRILSGKSNIYTGNLDREQLLQSVGNRLTSRIWNDSTKIEFFGNDRRGGNT